MSIVLIDVFYIL